MLKLFGPKSKPIRNFLEIPFKFFILIMKKLIVVEYFRINKLTQFLTLVSLPAILLLSYNLYDTKCEVESIKSINLIFYLILLTANFSLFLQFILYFQDFRTDKFILASINIFLCIYYILQLVTSIIVFNKFQTNKRCEMLNNMDIFGVIVLLLINAYFINLFYNIYSQRSLKRRLTK
jgi:hypothetical protein